MRLLLFLPCRQTCCSFFGSGSVLPQHLVILASAGKVSYHVSQLAALDAAFVSSHLYLTWVSTGEPLDDEGDAAETLGSTRIHASLQVLLGWYAGLTRNNPQIHTRLLLGVADRDADMLAAFASLHGLEVEFSKICPGSVAVFELRHRFMESSRGTAEMQAAAA